MRTISSKNELLVMELSNNVFKRFGIDPTISKDENSGVISLSWNENFVAPANLPEEQLEMAKASHAMSMKVIETCLMHRKQDGLLSDVIGEFIIQETLTVGCAYCVVNSQKDAESFVSRVLHKVDVYEDRYLTVEHPVDKDMLDFTTTAILVYGLSEDEEEALYSAANTNIKAKNMGNKIARIGKKADVAFDAIGHNMVKPLVGSAVGILQTTASVGIEAGVKGVLKFANGAVESWKRADFKNDRDFQQLMMALKKGKESKIDRGRTLKF